MRCLSAREITLALSWTHGSHWQTDSHLRFLANRAGADLFNDTMIMTRRPGDITSTLRYTVYSKTRKSGWLQLLDNRRQVLPYLLYLLLRFQVHFVIVLSPLFRPFPLKVLPDHDQRHQKQLDHVRNEQP